MSASGKRSASKVKGGKMTPSRSLVDDKIETRSNASQRKKQSQLGLVSDDDKQQFSQPVGEVQSQNGFGLFAMPSSRKYTKNPTPLRRSSTMKQTVYEKATPTRKPSVSKAR